MFRDELVQFRFGQTARTPFVAARFQNTRTGCEPMANIVPGKVIEEMDEGKRRSKNRDGPMGADGVSQRKKRLVDVECPRFMFVEFPGKKRITRAEFAANRFEHVNQRRMWREGRGRRQEYHSRFFE